jgi:hypothetical protein
MRRFGITPTSSRMRHLRAPAGSSAPAIFVIFHYDSFAATFWYFQDLGGRAGIFGGIIGRRRSQRPVCREKNPSVPCWSGLLRTAHRPGGGPLGHFVNGRLSGPYRCVCRMGLTPPAGRRSMCTPPSCRIPVELLASCLYALCGGASGGSRAVFPDLRQAGRPGPHAYRGPGSDSLYLFGPACAYPSSAALSS